jgi:hypothetical protein
MIRVQILEGSNFYLFEGSVVGGTKSGELLVVLDMFPQLPMMFAPREVIRAPVPL